MSVDFALLLLRLAVGVIIMGHGAQKLFGWFGGYGFSGTSGYMGGMLRLRPARFWTAVAILSELGGGLLLAAGFLSPLGSLGIMASMLMAIALVHWPKFWVSDNGMEYALVHFAAALSIAIAGPGAYSLDAVLGTALPAPATLIFGLVMVALGSITALATRTPVPAEAIASESAQQAA